MENRLRHASLLRKISWFMLYNQIVPSKTKLHYFYFDAFSNKDNLYFRA